MRLTKLPGTATFEAELTIPDLEVQWLRNEVPIKRSERIKMTSDGGRHKLVISDVEDKDEGEYTLVAKNSRSSALLTIQGGSGKYS